MNPKFDPLSHESLLRKSAFELVVIAADMDIPNRLEFPKEQLISMILRAKEAGARNSPYPLPSSLDGPSNPSPSHS